eukprot:5379421-Pleurochrysis_carterae.AAC.1
MALGSRNARQQHQQHRFRRIRDANTALHSCSLHDLAPHTKTGGRGRQELLQAVHNMRASYAASTYSSARRHLSE